MEPLQSYILDHLQIYHRIRGRNDRSPLRGVQKIWEPFTLDNVSLYCGVHPSLLYLPGNFASRQAIKTVYLEQPESSPVWLMKCFNLYSGLYLSPENQKVLNSALALVDEDFWVVRSSATGRHHPADEISPGGLILHTLRVVKMTSILIDLLGELGYKLTAEEQQDLYMAAFLHDSFKGHGDWTRTNYDHGHIAADKLKGIINDRTRDLIRSHMAQWNHPRPTPPSNLLEQVLSYADFICSRSDIYVELMEDPSILY